jgi:hypothetical protein
MRSRERSPWLGGSAIDRPGAGAHPALLINDLFTLAERLALTAELAALAVSRSSGFACMRRSIARRLSSG